MDVMDLNDVRGLNTLELQQLRIAVNREAEIRAMNGAPMAAMSEVAEKMGTAGESYSRGPLFPPTRLTLDNVEEAFRYHPWDSGQTDRGAQVRDVLVAAAKVILRVVPEGPDKSVGLRKLREVRMDCNSAITHGGRF